MIRKLRRSIAHSKMKKAGYVHVNKRVKTPNGYVSGDSFFSSHWREFG